jgi:hypothetical protein
MLGGVSKSFPGFSTSFKWIQGVHAGKRPVEGCVKKPVYMPSMLFVMSDLYKLVPSDMWSKLSVELWKMSVPGLGG